MVWKSFSTQEIWIFLCPTHIELLRLSTTQLKWLICDYAIIRIHRFFFSGGLEPGQSLLTCHSPFDLLHTFWLTSMLLHLLNLPFTFLLTLPEPYLYGNIEMIILYSTWMQSNGGVEWFFFYQCLEIHNSPTCL